MSTTTTGTEVLDGLEQAAREVASTVLPSVVGIGRNSRGSGVVVATEPGPHQRPQPPRPHHPGDLRRRSIGAGRRGRRRHVGRPRGPRGRHRRRAGGHVVRRGPRPRARWSSPSPAACGASRISFGIVSGTGRTFRGPKGRPVAGAVEHTAPLARGSSGGPLVDRHGAVVGLNTHRLGDGFYLAVAAGADLRRRVADLVGGRSAQRLTLGRRRRAGARGATPAQLGRPSRARRPPGPWRRGGLARGSRRHRSPATCWSVPATAT